MTEDMRCLIQRDVQEESSFCLEPRPLNLGLCNLCREINR